MILFILCYHFLNWSLKIRGFFLCVTNLDVHQESLGAPTSSSRLEPWSKQYEAALASGNDDFSQESRHGCWGNPPFLGNPLKKEQMVKINMFMNAIS